MLIPPKIHLATVLVLAGCLAAGGPSDDTRKKALEAKVRQIMVGKIATLQQFYKASDLQFDGEGNPLEPGKTGPWTYYGRVEVESVKFEGDDLVIKGQRSVAKWDPAANEFRNYSLKDSPVRINLHAQAGITEEELARALDRVFQPRNVKLSDLVPGYWKELLTTERQRRAEWEKQTMELMRSVTTVDAEVSLPKLLSSANGLQTSQAAYKELRENQSSFSFVVDENGEVKNVQIEKPIGLGIDDPVAELIERWKYEPARKNGHPVAVLMHARFTYFHRDGQIDPYHTMPCPGIDNFYQC